MIDNTLARMIDETLQERLEIVGFCRRKMLEVPVNQAHLSSPWSRLCEPSNPGKFVRDLFTIGRFKAFG